MQRAEAKQWFGAAPPDLTVIARARASEFGSGSDWLYTYLRTFYRDDSRPTGWNNIVFANVGMPHVLWELQGEQVMGEDHQLKLAKPGKLKPEEYDAMVADLVGYLTYMGEPVSGVSQESRRGRADRPGNSVRLLVCAETRILERHSLTNRNRKYAAYGAS